jgi:hypothetical protein
MTEKTMTRKDQDTDRLRRKTHALVDRLTPGQLRRVELGLLKLLGETWPRINPLGEP